MDDNQRAAIERARRTLHRAELNRPLGEAEDVGVIVKVADLRILLALADRPNPWRGISAAEYAVVEAARAEAKRLSALLADFFGSAEGVAAQVAGDRSREKS